MEALTRGEWKPGEAIPAERRLVRALRHQHRHRAQGDRRARRREHPDPPAGPRHLRREPQPRPAALLLLPHRPRARARRTTRRSSCCRSRGRKADRARRGRARRSRPATPCSASATALRARRRRRSSSTTSRCPRARFPGLTERAVPRPARRRSTTCTRTRSAFRSCAPASGCAPTLADAEIAALLGVARGAPLLQIRRVALSYNDEPVEFRVSLVNTAHYEYFGDIGAQLSDAPRRRSEREPQLRHRRETAPMRGTRSERASAARCQRRAVALVLREAVAGYRASSSTQHRVARGLGEDRRRRDRRHVAVALDDRADARSASTGQRLPSTSASSGATASPSQARRIASSVAWRMLSASISATSASAIAHASARSRITTASSSRRGADSSLESRSPAIGRAGSRITAAATTGPASGPRPASSIPAIRRPVVSASRALRRSSWRGTGAFTRRPARARRRPLRRRARRCPPSARRRIRRTAPPGAGASPCRRTG